MQDKNPLAHYSGVLSEAVQESAGAPDQAQIKALMRKHRIWIEHSTLFEDDLPARELRAVQAEQHQFEAFVQDLIALSAAKTTPESDYLEGVSIPNLREALIFLGRENGVGEGEVGDKLAQYVNSVVSGVLSKKAALREAPQAAPAAVAVPDGWKLVPVDLTPEMKREFMDLLMDGIDIYVNRRDQIEIQTDAPRRIWKAVLALSPAAPHAQADAQDADGLYYLQDARWSAMVGNCPSFWRLGGGYTTSLDDAERFTLEAAMKQHKCRETDLPWLCSELDTLSRPTIDCQYMPRSWDVSVR